MKLNRMRSVTSLQPDTRNGHKPAITAQFWGDASKGVRGTNRGAGKKIEAVGLPGIKPWYELVIPEPDPVTLKDFKPKIKVVNDEPPKLSLDKLIKDYNNRRLR